MQLSFSGVLLGVVVSLLSQGVQSFTLANDCPQWANNVNEAMASVQKMAKYAQGRARDTDPNHAKGTLLQDILRAPNELDPTTRSLIETWMQNVDSLSGNSNLLIHCSDSYLTTIDASKGLYRDTEHGNVQVRVPRPSGVTLTGSNACGGFMQGFTYRADGAIVIVLCSDSPASALQVTSGSGRQTFDSLRKNDIRGVTSGINFFNRFLSYILFHEMFHAAGFAHQQPGEENHFPQILPEKQDERPVPEAYRYEGITGSPVGTAAGTGAISQTNAQHNADGMAIVGSAWYMNAFAWKYGEAKLLSKSDYAPDEYPVQSKRRARNQARDSEA